VTRRRFLNSYEPNGRIRCVECPKHTRMTPEPNGEITADVVAYYKRIHVCGPADDPWDLNRTAAAS
jgi:hypothetical protein